MGRSNRTTRGPLPQPEVRPDEPSLTRFAGMIPLIVFMNENLGLPKLLLRAIGPDAARARRTHGVHLVLFAFVVGALAGVERLAHLEWLRDDFVLLKYLRLGSWPVRKVFSAALDAVSDAGTDAIEALVGDIGLDGVRDTDSVVLDFDNTAIVAYGEAEGAMFGYCGKGRRRRRHNPIVASIANTRAVLMARYRDGSEMTTDDHIEFFGAAVGRVRSKFAECVVSVRGDSGFWSPKLAQWLVDQRVKFTFALPLYASIKFMLMKAVFVAMTDDEDIEFAELDSGSLGLVYAGLKVVVVRRRVLNPKAPPQGKVISWSPEWRYQAIITSNTDWNAPDVWRFYNYRAECERVFRIGKQALALAHLVGHGLRANRVAFFLRLLAYNADLRFQQHAEDQARVNQRPVRAVGLEWRQKRFYLSPGRFLREHSRWILRTPVNRLLTDLWAFYAPDLATGLLHRASAVGALRAVEVGA